MRTVRRLRLRFLLLRPGYPNPNGFYIPELPSLLSSPVEICVWPIIKTQYQSKFTDNTKVNLCSYGGPAGLCPRVQDSFARKGLQLFFYLATILTATF